MRSVIKSAEADEDLLAIWRYIANDNPDAATRLILTMDKKFTFLAENPMLGQARPDIAPGVRNFVVGSYLILYQETADGILIVRVVHGARNIHDMLAGE